jgi:hypothetical protein
MATCIDCGESVRRKERDNVWKLCPKCRSVHSSFLDYLPPSEIPRKDAGQFLKILPLIIGFLALTAGSCIAIL